MTVLAPIDWAISLNARPTGSLAAAGGTMKFPLSSKKLIMSASP